MGLWLIAWLFGQATGKPQTSIQTASPIRIGHSYKIVTCADAYQKGYFTKESITNEQTAFVS